MSYEQRVTWTVVPNTVPTVIKNCPKCGGKAVYKNSGKFRVNANKSYIDIWLIYFCEHCKSTWNMTIYERCHPKALNQELYQRFMANDEELAKEIGFDISHHNRNKVQLNLEQVQYDIEGEDLELLSGKKYHIEINCPYPIGTRMDKILSEKLEVSRSKVKAWSTKGWFNGSEGEKVQKMKLKKKNNVIIHMPEG